MGTPPPCRAFDETELSDSQLQALITFLLERTTPMTTYALPRRRGVVARLIGEADDFTSWLLFGGETWLIASLKAVPLFLFIYWLFTYVPNSIFYGVTQYIPFLQFSPEVGFIVANGVAWTNVVLIVILAVRGPGVARPARSRLDAGPAVRPVQLRRRHAAADPVPRVQRGRWMVHPARAAASSRWAWGR